MQNAILPANAGENSTPQAHQNLHQSDASHPLEFATPNPQASIHYRRPAAEFKVLRIREIAPDKPNADCPERAVAFRHAAVPSAQWFDPDRECLVAITLDTRRKATGFYLISIGSLDTILVHPREVFKSAILLAAASIVLVHNHPSGDPSPSEADIRITRQLIQAAAILKIPIDDHLVIGTANAERPRGWCSLRELGYLAV